MTNTLAQSLSGLNVAPGDTPWGIGAMTLAQSSPLLLNPYSSWQKNLAIGLGANLIAGLLGYQARQSAMQQNLALQPYITQALKAPTMESLDQILAQEDAAPLRSLGAQLKINLLENQAAAEKRKQDLRDALLVAGIKEGYIPKSLEGEFGTTGLDAEGLTPRQRQELNLFEKKEQRKTEIELPEKQRQRAWEQDKVSIDFAQQFSQKQVVKDYEKLSRFNATIRELARNPTRANIDTMITFAKKAQDPDSAVTLGEYTQTADQQSAADKYKQILANLASSNPRLSSQAIAEMVQASDVVTQMVGQAYNKQIDNALTQAKASGLPNFNLEKLGRTYYQQQGAVNTASDDAKVLRMREIKAQLQTERDPQRIRALQLEAQGIYQGGQSGR